MQPRTQRRSGRVSGTAPTHVPVNVSASVRRVIAFAEAQVGKSYGWGAAGPNAYDCSGLTMAAWRQAGVNLPHSAAGQYGYGTHVAYSQLRPGDLIFLYSPIGHVELYVGDDLAVSAADPSIGIVYVHPSRDMADYAGATRLMG
jgi:cell wall-associated NlpC family hydrolase